MARPPLVELSYYRIFVSRHTRQPAIATVGCPRRSDVQRAVPGPRVPAWVHRRSMDDPTQRRYGAVRLPGFRSCTAIATDLLDRLASFVSFIAEAVFRRVRTRDSRAPLSSSPDDCTSDGSQPSRRFTITDGVERLRTIVLTAHAPVRSVFCRETHPFTRLSRAVHTSTSVRRSLIGGKWRTARTVSENSPRPEVDRPNRFRRRRSTAGR